MAYALATILTLEQMAQFRPGVGAILSVVIDNMRTRIERETLTFDDIDTKIRPWPVEIGESSASGYDKLAPRMGIQIILTTRP